MKKTLIVLALVVIFVLATATGAWAIYKPMTGPLIDRTGTANDVTASYPAADYPHGGYSATSNLCKVCHGIHEAEVGYMMLRFPTGITPGPSTACNYCHVGPAPYTLEVVYTAPGTVGGEHSVAPAAGQVGTSSTTATPQAIPDSGKGNVPGNYGLNCKSCHSVHGSQIVTAAGNFILRNDPAYDTGVATTESEFCADCHSRNTDEATGNDTAAQPVLERGLNGRTHVMTTATSMPISNTQALTLVAWDTSEECYKCHSAARTPLGSGGGDTYGSMSFPHQSTGQNLLRAEVTTSNWDIVCRACHTSGDSFTAGSGVGLTF